MTHLSNCRGLKVGSLPVELKLTPAEELELEAVRVVARARHARAKAAAKARGRLDFPLLPFECSWAYSEQFRREIRAQRRGKVCAHLRS